MELKRRIALSAALLAVGLGSGHIVQNRSAVSKAEAQAAAQAAKPKEVTLLSGEAEKTVPKAPLQVQAALPVPDMAPVAPAVKPSVTPSEKTVATQPAVPTPKVPIGGAPAVQLAADCPVTLDILPQTSAMLSVTLIAPCQTDQRVVLRHGGLAITAKTSVTGSLFMDIPALETDAKVEMMFKDGATATAETQVPDLAQMQRFAVQWMDRDAFQVHAFEDGADYNQPGHVSAVTPHLPKAGIPTAGGYLTVLGDATVTLPMLAEVYTFPTTKADPVDVDVVVEAAVTTTTCGRELLGETLTSHGGSVYVTDLTLAMPECDAAGDILVLKNLVPDMTLAAK